MSRVEILRPVSLASVMEHKDGMAILGLFARRHATQHPLVIVSLEAAAAPDRILLMTAIRAWSRVLIEPAITPAGLWRAVEWQGYEEDEDKEDVAAFFASIPLKRRPYQPYAALKPLVSMGFHALSGGSGPPPRFGLRCRHAVMPWFEEFARGDTSVVAVPVYSTQGEWLAARRGEPLPWQLAISPRLVQTVLIPTLGDQCTMRSLWWMAQWMPAEAAAMAQHLLNVHDRLLFLVSKQEDFVRAWRILFESAPAHTQWTVVATLMRRALETAALGQPAARHVSLSFSLRTSTLLAKVSSSTTLDGREEALKTAGLTLGLETPSYRVIVHMERGAAAAVRPRSTLPRAPITRIINVTVEEQWRQGLLLETYGQPLITERPQTSLVLQWRGREEGRLLFDAPYVPDANVGSLRVHLPRHHLFLAIMVTTTTTTGMTPTWPSHWWTHILIVGAHRMDDDALDALQDYVAEQRLANGIAHDEGTLALAGCPVFEYAQGYHADWRERAAVGVHNVDDLMRPPSVETCDALRQLVAKNRGTIRIEEASSAGPGPSHPTMAHVPASSNSRLYATLMNANGECGGSSSSSSSSFYCPRLRRACRWALHDAVKQMTAAACDVDHQRPWTELPPALLDERYGAGLRHLALMEWRLRITEASLFWMTRDQLYWLADFAAREPRARITLVLKPAATSAIPAEARDSGEAADVLLYMLGRTNCLPTLNWTTKD